MGTAGPVGLLKEFTVTGQGCSVHYVVRMFIVRCVICCITWNIYVPGVPPLDGPKD